MDAPLDEQDAVGSLRLVGFYGGGAQRWGYRQFGVLVASLAPAIDWRARVDAI